MTKDSRYWGSKILYLRNVKGEDITKKYDELNDNPNFDVIATQIFPISTGNLVHIYDAFIYYKSKFGNVKGLC